MNLSEQVKACCTIAREKLEAGDYDEGCAALQRWWTVGEWPTHSGLEDRAAAELLFTAGVLSGLVGSIKQTFGGQKPAEALLNGAITLFERLGETTRVAEARVELASCYYRQGLFDLARVTLRTALQGLSENENELKSIGPIRLAVVERHTGRLHDAVDLLNEAAPFVETSGAWTRGFFHLEFAVALKDLGISESRSSYFDKAQAHYLRFSFWRISVRG